MNRTSIINYFIKKNKFSSYLEIGVRDKNENFNLINCNKKVGVDPNPNAKATFCLPSDVFFEKNTDIFDVIFIDGLHLKDQFVRDVKNGLKFLNKDGVIVCHDCLPSSYSEQIEEYDGKSAWVGTVWKGFAALRMSKKDLSMLTVDTDYGCGIIKYGKQDLFINKNNEEVNYDFFVKYRNDLMNVIKVEEFLKLY